MDIENVDKAKPYEYFMLFFYKKSQKQIEEDLEQWTISCQNEIKQFNSQFV